MILNFLGVIQSTVQDDASWNGRWSRSGPISQTNRRISQLSRGDFPDSREEIGLEEGSVINALVKNKGRRRFFSLKVFDIGKLVTCLVRSDPQAIDQVFSSTECRVMWWTIHRLNSNEPEEFRSFHTSLPRLFIQSRHFTVDNVTVDSLHLKSVKRHFFVQVTSLWVIENALPLLFSKMMEQ